MGEMRLKHVSCIQEVGASAGLGEALKAESSAETFQQEMS